MKIIKHVKDILYDRMWHYLSTLKDCTECPRFARLTKLVKLILVIPHSNAEEERVFSLVRKNKTCFRPNLDLDESLASIITCKLAMEGESVTKFSISDDIISTAKQATTKYNKQHSQKEWSNRVLNFSFILCSKKIVWLNFSFWSEVLRKSMDWFLYDNDLRHERVFRKNSCTFRFHTHG